MSIHADDCTCTALGCVLRRGGGVQIAPSATPSTHNRKPPDNARYNGWERGYAGETRADGSFMPYLTDTGSRMRQREFAQRRDQITTTRRQQIAAGTTHEGN